MKEEDGNQNTDGRGREKYVLLVFNIFPSLHIMDEVNLEYQFDWSLEMIIFLVAVDKLQDKAANGRNDISFSCCSRQNIIYCCTWKKLFRRNLCNYYTDQCM
jgi:hypothetical protein